MTDGGSAFRDVVVARVIEGAFPKLREYEALPLPSNYARCTTCNVPLNPQTTTARLRRCRCVRANTGDNNKCDAVIHCGREWCKISYANRCNTCAHPCCPDCLIECDEEPSCAARMCKWCATAAPSCEGSSERCMDEIWRCAAHCPQTTQYERKHPDGSMRPTVNWACKECSERWDVNPRWTPTATCVACWDHVWVQNAAIETCAECGDGICPHDDDEVPHVCGPRAAKRLKSD